MAHPILLSSSEGLWLVLVAAGGAAAGVYLYLRGFRLLRLKRLILNTPFSRIHSASIGLVEVAGTPVGPQVLTAPLSGDSCFYYRVRAWQWVQSDDKHEWKSVLDESHYVPFFLEDQTGRVLVDPQGAEMDVHRSFADEVGASLFRTDLIPPNMRDFLLSRGLVPYEKIKLEECVIPQGFPLFVFGTLGENLSVHSWSAAPHVSSGGGDSFDFSIGSGSIGLSFRAGKLSNLRSLLSSGPVQSLNRIPGIQVGTACMTLPASAIPRRVSACAAAAGSLPGALSVAKGAEQSASAAVPQVTAIAGESPLGDFDLHPSTAISKGERNGPFVISWHSQKEVAGKLAWKSAACIWGGPALTLACLYFLMMYFRWIF